MLDQDLLRAILREIDSRLSQGLVPVHNGHLANVSQMEEPLGCLLLMKKQGLISGDLITKGADSIPYRITNIRLTYLGIRVLRS